MPRCRVPDLSKRCPRCFVHHALCLCADVPRIETRTRILVLRHASERLRTTNSGRWAALALASARIVDYAVAGETLDDTPLREEGTWVLFPDAATDAAPAPPPRQIVVLDGTWTQARRMLQRIEALRGLPHLALPPPRPGTERLRRPPPGGMSTLEAIARALERVGEPAAAEHLDRVHALALRRAEQMRGAPLPTPLARRAAGR